MAKKKSRSPTGNDVFAADKFGESCDTLSDKLGVFDDVARMRDHSWDNHLAFGQFHSFPDMILVLVARVRSFKRVGAGIYFQDQVHDVLSEASLTRGPSLIP